MHQKYLQCQFVTTQSSYGSLRNGKDETWNKILFWSRETIYAIKALCCVYRVNALDLSLMNRYYIKKWCLMHIISIWEEKCSMQLKTYITAWTLKLGENRNSYSICTLMNYAESNIFNYLHISYFSIDIFHDKDYFYLKGTFI